MTKKRKIWLISWGAGIVLLLITGLPFAFMVLVLFAFIELIRLFFVSLKRSKQKMADIKAGVDKASEQRIAVEESLITTGLPPQNTPSEFVFTVGLVFNPIIMLALAIGGGSSVTKQQNRIKEARTQRDITLSPEAYAASETYFDGKRAEASRFMLPAVLVSVGYLLVITVVLNAVIKLLNS
jgi:hypothetical protein